MTVVDHPATRSKSGPPAGTGEPQLPSERIDQIRTRLRKHINDNEDEVSQAKIARAVSYSSAAIAQFLSNSYAGNASNIARAIERHIDLYEQQKSIGAQPLYVKTSTVKKIERAIFMAQATRGIAIIATQTGVGLSMAFNEHIRRYPLTLKLECSPEMGSRWALLTELLQIIGKENRRPADARRAIVDSLAGTDRTLLVDESHYLSQECVDIIRRIHDQAGVPVVLGGNEATYQGFRTRNYGSANRGMEAMAYTQLRGRLAARLQVRSEDITTNDIRLVATQMAPADAIEDAIEQLKNESLFNGGLRRVVRIIHMAQMLASGKGIKKAHVLRAIEEITQLSGGDEC
jgi:DNA transposition AAA+ family ATPase